MKLVGELKEKVEKAENLEEAKKTIANAGMELTDEEMAEVAGGAGICPGSQQLGNIPEGWESRSNSGIGKN